jgi:hypothetical protein
MHAQKAARAGRLSVWMRTYQIKTRLAVHGSTLFVYDMLLLRRKRTLPPGPDGIRRGGEPRKFG